MKRRHLTLSVIESNGKLLLGYKKRGYATGIWNGYGGKVEKRESPEQAMIRELLEESGLAVLQQEKVAYIEFTSDVEDELFVCHIYKIHKYSGKPVETEEMKPGWFYIDKLPYDRMWPDDPHWLPLVLAGKKVRGSFVLLNNNKTIDTMELSEVDSL